MNNELNILMILMNAEVGTTSLVLVGIGVNVYLGSTGYKSL